MRKEEEAEAEADDGQEGFGGDKIENKTLFLRSTDKLSLFTTGKKL